MNQGPRSRARRAGAMAGLLAGTVAVAVLLPWWASRSGPVPEGPAALAVEPALPVFEPEDLVAAGVGVAYPGAVWAMGVGSRIERVAGAGRIGWRPTSPPVITDATLYDLASLTKAMATTVAVLLLVQDGRIELDEPVRRQLPGFEGQWKEQVTWRHLLTHTSGLPPGTVINGATPAERERRLLRTKLHVPPGRGVAYSDVGYVVLWAAATRVAGEPLPALLERRVWRPLGMTSTKFSPGTDCEACAPTLRLRDGTPFRGLPSDLLARRLGGTTGNAGLFSTAPDVARFAAMIAAGGELDGVRILEPGLVRELFRQQPRAGRRTLGWTAFCPDEEPDANRPCAAPLAYGHTGWTGTSIWIEPDRGHWVVLLTNRSYERTRQPFPLDPLRRDLFLNAADIDRAAPPQRWLAAAAPPPDTGRPADYRVAPAAPPAAPAAAPF